MKSKKYAWFLTIVGVICVIIYALVWSDIIPKQPVNYKLILVLIIAMVAPVLILITGLKDLIKK
jgi:hypothetical protein